MNSRPLVSISSVIKQDRVWRGALLLAIIVAHLLLLLQLALRSPSTRVDRPVTMSVFTIPLASARGASAEALPERVPPFPAHVSPAIASRLPAEADLAPSPLSGGIASPVSSPNAGSCALDQNVGRAIGQDPAAMREIETLPSDVRTPADAILLWNGRWLDAGSTSVETSNDALRQAVERAIAGASPDCRDVASTGPHFIAVPAGSRTMMVVIGSGTWRWADLVAPVVDCLPAAAIACSRERIVTEAARMASP